MTTMSLQAAVAARFAQRPTARQVVRQFLARWLFEQYPGGVPTLPQTPDLVLVQGDAAGLYRTVLHLDDWVLQRLHDPSAGALADAGPIAARIGLAPHDLLDIPGFDVRDLRAALEELRACFTALMCAAQVDYWNVGLNGQPAPLAWLIDALRRDLAVLLTGSPTQADEREALARLVAGPQADQSPVPVWCVDVRLTQGGQRYQQLLTSVLIELPGGELLHWRPGQAMQRLESREAFARQLSRDLAARYRFESLHWQCYSVDEAPFTQLAQVLLNRILEQLQPVQGRRFADVPALEAGYQALTDPGRLMGSTSAWGASAQPVPQLPAWLSNAHPAQAARYADGLVRLGAAQQPGQDYLDGVETLQAYAGRVLRERLLADHPDDANYQPDEVVLRFKVAHGVGQAPGFGVVETVELTLTAFALGNLANRPKGPMTIHHRHGQWIMPWLDEAYVLRIVRELDIGGRYPRQLRQQLAAGGEDRTRRYFDALCTTLPLLAQEQWLRRQGALDLHGVALVQAGLRGEPQARVLDLGLRALPERAADPVLNHFLFMPTAGHSGPLVLFRPAAPPCFQQFFDEQALLDALAAPGELNAHLLAALPDHTRPVYDHGGIHEPHLGGVVDTQVLPSRPSAARLDLDSPQASLASRLYAGQVGWLVQVAERSAVSDTASDQALLREGLGLLWQTVLPLVRGPIGFIAWAWQLADSLVADTRALREGDGFARAAAVTDLLLNLAMLLAHGAPGVTPVMESTPLPPLYEPPAAQADQAQAIVAAALPDRRGQPLADDTLWLDSRWSGPLGRLDRASRLRLNRLAVGARPPAQSRLDPDTGLYQRDQVHFVELDGLWFQVQARDGGWTVIGPDGVESGPRLRRHESHWTLDLDVRLRGGGPKRDRTRFRAERDRTMKAQVLAFQEQGRHADQLYGLAADVLHSMPPLRDAYTQTIRRAGIVAGLLDKASGDEVQRWQAELKRCHDAQVAARAQASTRLKTLQQHADAVVDATDLLFQTYDGLDAAFAEPLAALVRQSDERVAGLLLGVQQEIKLELVDVPLGAVTQQLRVFDAPDEPGYMQVYERFVVIMEAVVRLQDDQLRHERQLDKVLSRLGRQGNAGRAIQVTFERWRNPLDHVVGRQVDLLQSLAELSLVRPQRTQSPLSEYFMERLLGPDLQEAAFSHEAVVREAGFSDEELSDVFSSAVTAYERAMDVCRVGLQIEDSYLRKPALQRLSELLTQLHDDAQSRLAAEIREAATLVLPAPPRAGKGPHVSRIIRTRGQRTLVARPGRDTPEEGGLQVVEVRHRSTDEVLARYVEHADEGVWVELQTLPATSVGDPARPSPRKARAQGQSLLDAQARVRAGAEAQARVALRPVELQDMLDQQANRCEAAARQLTDSLARPYDADDARLLDDLASAAREYRALGLRLRIAHYLASGVPSGENLLFLLEQRVVNIARIDERKRLADDDFLEVHTIRDLKGVGLWEAHFHYPSRDTPRARFSKGHLKTWAQRHLGRQQQLAQARSQGEVVAIHRGDLGHRLAARLFVLDD